MGCFARDGLAGVVGGIVLLGLLGLGPFWQFAGSVRLSLLSVVVVSLSLFYDGGGFGAG